MHKPMDNICRTCLLYNEEQSLVESEPDGIKMVSIFIIPEEAKQENLSLRDLLKATVPQLNLKENDLLPKNICNKCSEKIIDIYNFQVKCLKNEETICKLLELGDISNLFNSTRLSPEMLFKNAEMAVSFSDTNSMELITDEKIFENNFLTSENTNSSDDLVCDGKNESSFVQSKVNIKEEKVKKRSNKNVKKKVKRAYLKCPSKSKQHDTKELYSCGKCQRKLKSELSLIKHHELHMRRAKEEKELKCSICNKAEKPFLCSECGKGFTSAGSLKQHSFRHLDKKLYPCSDCPKSFPTSGDLLCHYEIHKAKPRIHVCDVCGRGFHKPFLLKQHQRYHNNERPFACEFCEKKFVTSEKQRRHMRTHTGEKPYRCKYCDRAFAQSNDCIKHLRQHLGDNVYQCELCPLRFPLARDLRIHFATHKDDDAETRSRNLRARIEEEKKLEIKLS